MEFQLSYFKCLKIMNLKCCTQNVSKFGKFSSGHRTGKGQFSSIPKKGSAKECTNYCTTVLISHARKAMLRILPARLQPDVQVDFRKSRGTRDKLPTFSGS